MLKKLLIEFEDKLEDITYVNKLYYDGETCTYTINEIDIYCDKKPKAQMTWEQMSVGLLSAFETLYPHYKSKLEAMEKSSG